MRHVIVEEDLNTIAAANLPWNELRNKTVLVSGAAGFLPAYLVETILYLNERRIGESTHVVGLVRSIDRATQRFSAYHGRADLQLVKHDVALPLPDLGHIDFIIHAASQASPKFYRVDPAGTLDANILGTHHLLSLARAQLVKGFLFFSSGDVYGPRPAATPTNEGDFGPLDPLDPRSCYGEAKRLAETMCVAWQRQFGVPAVIVRPFHTYGPGMRLDDGRVFADFVADAIQRRPIVLKSDGAATRAFCYLADATTGFFSVLLRGKHGEAYNIGNDHGECSIAELAELFVRLFPDRCREVVRTNRHPDDVYVTSTLARSCPDITRARALGWQPFTNLVEGFSRTVRSFT